MSDPVDRETAVSRLRSWFRSHDPAGTAAQIGAAEIAGRTVAEPVVAPADVPARPFATMDGFALASDDTQPRPVEGGVAPEDDPEGLTAGAAVRIATGAPLPDGADAVVPVEASTVVDGALTTDAPAPGTNVFPSGATAAAGDTLFEAGERLSPRHASLLADVGIDRVAVRPRRSAAVLATGTEIAAGEQPDRDSAMLANVLRRWGCDPAVLDPVPDDAGRVADAIAEAADRFDFVVTAGGTSVGAGDHVGAALADTDRLGGDLLFDAVALRPGRPTTAAVVDGTLVCAFPGKPLAAHKAATLVLRPAMTGEHGTATVSATAASFVDLPDGPGAYAVPVHLRDGRAVPAGQGTDSASLYETRFRPGRVSSSTRCTLADGLAVREEPIERGEPVAVTPYEVIE
ncbi:molybdopterin molybdotransferase MoeA [Halobaculum magnesiiphilum]|nr:molybdopterin molybdotransferase MoeA [Halobaculum magnesiiphilum]